MLCLVGDTDVSIKNCGKRVLKEIGKKKKEEKGEVKGSVSLNSLFWIVFLNI